MATYEDVKDIPNHPEAYLIDVRNADELESTGVIPASINIPLPELKAALNKSNDEFKAAYKRPKPKEDSYIIFTCLAGGRAQRAAEQAILHGFVNAKAYKGSWTEWAQKEGL
ncbi:rhodanese domain-containing protein CG4456 [Eupeodes corollae]|uniref:rhodanese domain-containing protein CG4456 n=1 Tax=Eupeodes corollae TaxID=290404 RepID=UPI00248FF934|nr:rhodanese domain-containing protein CG4456 [Eupeodes corollae]